MSEPQGHDLSTFPWREAFHDRLTTASKALASLRRGSRIFIGSGSGEPTVLIDELTRAARRLTDLEVLPRKDLQEFVNIDYRESMTIVGFHRDPFRGKRIVALGQYFLHRATNTAEVAFIVNDDWQNRGIGTWLLVYLAKIAREQGIQGFFAEVLLQNHQMLRVFHKSAFPMTSETEDDVVRVKLAFADQGRDIDAQVDMNPASASDKEESIDVEPREDQTDG